MPDASERPTPTRAIAPWIAAGLVVAVAAVVLGVAPVRHVVSGFLSTLRDQPVQAVDVNLSALVGPEANATLQQMVTEMISDKVTTVANEDDQPASSVDVATQLAGFHVQLPADRTDVPELAVGGAHEFTIVVDRARLQAILSEAGRTDLVLPASIDGTTIHARIHRTVRARYGDCPGRPSVTANVATPTPSGTTQYSGCVILNEGPSPAVDAPAGFDFNHLVEIALELAGMTPDQARQFLSTVDWTSTLTLSIPRSLRSYQRVTVNGVPGTLFDMAGRRGPTYTLLWTKDHVLFALTGFNDASNAATLANSIR